MTLTLPALDPESIEVRKGTNYPPPFDKDIGAREKRALGDAFGLTNYGVNLVTIPPGCVSSQRHWHSDEDEFVYMISGELVLITDGGEQTLTPGMAAGFPAGKADGHQIVNRSDAAARYLEVGDRSSGDVCSYPDIDLHLEPVDGQHTFLHKDGTPY